MNLTPFCLELHLKTWHKAPQPLLLIKVAHDGLLLRYLKQAGWKVFRHSRQVAIKSPAEIALRVGQLWPDCPKTLQAALDAYAALDMVGAMKYSKAERADRFRRRTELAEQIHRIWTLGADHQ